jgi:hypothetical protein
MGTIYKTLFYLIFGIAGGSFAIAQIHTELVLELVLETMFLSVTLPIGFLYLRYLEKHLGVSIFRRPKLDLLIEADDNEKVRDIFYAVSKALASTYQTLRAGERYLLAVIVDDHLPHTLWLELSFLKMHDDDSHSSYASKISEALFSTDDKVLSISCGHFGGKEPFELLENSFTAELARRSMPWKELFKRWPH